VLNIKGANAMSPAPLNQLSSFSCRLVAAFGLAVTCAGCFLNGGSTPPAVTVSEVTVDTGARLDVTAGQLQGVFVEYGGGGDWKVYTSCDTTADGNTCNFDLTLSTADAKGFTNPTGINQEPRDTVTLMPDGSVHLVFDTATQLDGVTFTTTAGAILRVDANINGASASRLVNWISDGVVQNGAPSNPVDFSPSNP
jgi:hypothetical protein